ncbi:MAG: polymer-forming cytoskeletal protein [Lachnospiraceae bacterium]|nr:polymer-forming cytoskeletal protein [Lachnospiraceae bacterium]
MGFFTDLKEDISQTVGDVLPEEDENLDELLGDLLADESLLQQEEAPEAADDDSELPDELPDVSELLESVDLEEPEVSLPEIEMTEAAEEEAAEAEAEAEEAEPEEVVDAFSADLDAMLDQVEMNTMKEGNESMNDESIYVATAEAEMMKNDMIGKSVSDETALITAKMKMIGDITSEGSLELEGSVTGNIDILGKLNITGNIDGDSKAAEIFADNAKINGEVRSMGSVKIGQSTVIIGNIFANSAVIAGAVKGDIDVMGPVILDTSAIVMGNIKSKSVQINNGAVIEGMCSQCYAEINPTSFFEEIKKGKK